MAVWSSQNSTTWARSEPMSAAYQLIAPSPKQAIARSTGSRWRAARWGRSLTSALAATTVAALL